MEPRRDCPRPKMIPYVSESGKLEYQEVIYEWIPICCSHCNKFGHGSKQCSLVPKIVSKWIPKDVNIVESQPEIVISENNCEGSNGKAEDVEEESSAAGNFLESVSEMRLSKEGKALSSSFEQGKAPGDGKKSCETKSVTIASRPLPLQNNYSVLEDDDARTTQMESNKDVKLGRGAMKLGGNKLYSVNE